MLDDEDVKRKGLLILKDKSVDWYKYLSPDTVTGGLGSQVFGPNRSNERTVPVVMTRGASEVGFYVASSGQQAMMMGFLVVDGSDAPESYGEAFHTISGRDSVTDAVYSFASSSLLCFIKSISPVTSLPIFLMVSTNPILSSSA